MIPLDGKILHKSNHKPSFESRNLVRIISLLIFLIELSATLVFSYEIKIHFYCNVIVGRSHRTDTSLDAMCQFEDDDLPVRGKHRSKKMKYLIRKSHLS